MSRICALCGKKPIISVTRKKLRGKYNPTAKRWQRPNLQWVRLFSGERIKACTKCIRRLHKLHNK